jgi:hypothetical protein
VQAAFTCDQDTAFVFARFLDGFESSQSSSRGVSNASEDCLIVHARAAGELGAAETEGRGACLADYEVAGLEELAEGLESC